MINVNVKVPELLGLNEMQLSIMLASRLYEEGRLSLGQAAEMASLSKRTFAELLGSYGVSIFNYPPSDLTKDVAKATSYAI